MQPLELERPLAGLGAGVEPRECIGVESGRRANPLARRLMQALEHRTTIHATEPGTARLAGRD